MNKFYYLRGAFGDPRLIEEHEAALNQLKQGDFSSKNIEKLQGHDVYSFRLSDCARLLFTLININDAPYLLVLDYLPTHDYHKSRFLRSKVLRNYIEQHTPTFHTIQFESAKDTHIDRIKNINTVEHQAETQYEVVDYYQQHIIQLTPHQKNAANILLPAIIHGVAGSGKSCVALSTISSYILTQDENAPCKVLYVSKSSALVDSMRDAWEKLPISIDTPHEIYFLTYHELLNIAEHHQNDFLLWYTAYQNKMRHVAKSQTLDPGIVYEEFRICSGYETAEYLALGERQSLVTRDQRQNILTMFQDYIKHKTDPAFLPIPKNPIYDLILVDEAQDLSLLALNNLDGIAKDHRIIYFIDNHQQLYDRRSVCPYLLHKFQIPDERHIRLNTIHRCPFKVIQVINTILDFKHRLVGGLSDKHAIARIEEVTLNQTMGAVYVLSPHELNTLPWKTIEKGPQFAVVTCEQYLEQAREEFNTPLVFTPEAIKGLEYDVVVTYNLYDKQLFKSAFQRSQKVGENIPRHQPKAGNADEQFVNGFNRIYTSYTRAKKMLIICENPTRNNQELLNQLQSKANKGLPSELIQNPSSREEWQREVINQLKNANIVMARNIFLQKIGDEIDFQALLKSQTPVKKLEITPAAALPITKMSAEDDKPKIAKKTSRPEPTTEQKYAERLFAQYDRNALIVVLNLCLSKKFDLEDFLFKQYNYHGTKLRFIEFIQQNEQIMHDFFAYLVDDLIAFETIVPKLPLPNMQIANAKQFLINLDAMRVIENHIIGAKAILKLAKITVDKLSQGYTLAVLFTELDKIDALQELHSLGVDFNKADREGRTPGYFAAALCHFETIEFLGNCGVNFNKPDNQGRTSAHMAILAAEHSSTAEDDNNVIHTIITLKKFYTDFNQPDINGQTPAHYAARIKRSSIMHALFVRAQADLSQAHLNGLTPLIIAIKENNFDVVQYLVKMGVPLNIPYFPNNKNSLLPIELAHILKFNNIINCLENAIQKEIILNSRINFFHGQPPVENQTNQTSNQEASSKTY